MNDCDSKPVLLQADRLVNFRGVELNLHLEFYECQQCLMTYMRPDQMQTALDQARLKWESCHAPS